MKGRPRRAECRLRRQARRAGARRRPRPRPLPRFRRPTERANKPANQGDYRVSDFDLVVIGSGPGGYVAAIRASEDSDKELGQAYGVKSYYVARIRRGDARRDYASPWAGLGARA